MAFYKYLFGAKRRARPSVNENAFDMVHSRRHTKDRPFAYSYGPRRYAIYESDEEYMGWWEQRRYAIDEDDEEDMEWHEPGGRMINRSF